MFGLVCSLQTQLKLTHMCAHEFSATTMLVGFCLLGLVSFFCSYCKESWPINSLLHPCLSLLLIFLSSQLHFLSISLSFLREEDKIESWKYKFASFFLPLLVFLFLHFRESESSFHQGAWHPWEELQPEGRKEGSWSSNLKAQVLKLEWVLTPGLVVWLQGKWSSLGAPHLVLKV